MEKKKVDLEKRRGHCQTVRKESRVKQSQAKRPIHLQNGSREDCYQADNSGKFRWTEAESGVVRRIIGCRWAWSRSSGRGAE